MSRFVDRTNQLMSCRIKQVSFWGQEEDIPQPIQWIQIGNLENLKMCIPKCLFYALHNYVRYKHLHYNV